MGRPLKKDVNGVEVLGSYTGAAAGIRCSFHDGSTVQTDGILMKQRGAKTFVVAQVGTPATTFTCVLVSGNPTAGQMRIQGSTTGLLDQNLVAIAKITKRIATDFSGNRYTWFLDNDSSGDVLTLTAV
jgi:hypothetical protein